MDTKSQEEKFYDLFNGYSDIAGGGTGYKRAYEWLTSTKGSELPKCLTCLIIWCKPKRLLFTGSTKSGKGNGQKINKALSKFLPMLTEEDMPTDEADMRKFEKTRKEWDPCFKKLNSSMVRRVALMFTEATSIKNTWESHKSLLQFKSVYAGSVRLYKLPNDLSGDKNIRNRELKSFVDQETYWKPYVELLTKVKLVFPEVLEDEPEKLVAKAETVGEPEVNSDNEDAEPESGIDGDDTPIDNSNDGANESSSVMDPSLKSILETHAKDFIDKTPVESRKPPVPSKASVPKVRIVTFVGDQAENPETLDVFKEELPDPGDTSQDRDLSPRSRSLREAQMSYAEMKVTAQSTNVYHLSSVLLILSTILMSLSDNAVVSLFEVYVKEFLKFSLGDEARTRAHVYTLFQLLVHDDVLKLVGTNSKMRKVAKTLRVTDVLAKIDVEFIFSIVQSFSGTRIDIKNALLEQ